MIGLPQDLRYAVRQFLKMPGLAAVLIITIALAVGANTALFSVVDAVLLRPIPYSNPDRVVTVMEASPSKKEQVSLIAPARLADWNRPPESFCRSPPWTLTR